MSTALKQHKLHDMIQMPTWISTHHVIVNSCHVGRHVLKRPQRTLPGSGYGLVPRLAYNMAEAVLIFSLVVHGTLDVQIKASNESPHSQPELTRSTTALRLNSLTS